MGYTTDFVGKVRIAPPLNTDEVAYLRRFSGTRRMATKEGPYFVDQPGFHGQDDGENVVDSNRPADGQPSLWCEWVPVDDGTAIEWSGGEKFSDAEAWMAYLIDHFLRAGAKGVGAPQLAAFTFDHVVDGVILASGEEYPDLWRIDVVENVVSSERYDVEEGLSEELLESGHSLGDALFTLREDPAKAVDLLQEFIGAVPEEAGDRDALASFLRDLAGALPSELGQKVLASLSGWA